MKLKVKDATIIEVHLPIRETTETSQPDCARKVYRQQWDLANPEKIKAYRDKHNKTKGSIVTRAKWKKANREKLLIQARELRKKNPDKHKKANRDHYNRDPEKQRKRTNNWREKNPEKARIHGQNRTTRIRVVGGVLSKDIILKLLLLQKERCSICRSSLRKTGYHLDHIIPLIRGGKNSDSNVQLTCPKCNLKKGSKDPIKFMQELGYLL